MGDLDRIRWRCRRGLLELDIVLGRFVDQHLAGLDTGEREGFKALLELSDNDLWDLVAGRTEPEAGLQEHLIRRLRRV